MTRCVLDLHIDNVCHEHNLYCLHPCTAAGDLYLDDGHSYAFTRGQYAHRAFKYTSHKLTSTAAPVAAGKEFIFVVCAGCAQLAGSCPGQLAA